MGQIKNKERVPFPEVEPQENFIFDTVAEAGTFSFHFKWLNDRWNVWVTLPDGSTRQAGVEPNVMSWTGYGDFGLVFETPLNFVDFQSLFLTELYILTWQ